MFLKIILSNEDYIFAKQKVNSFKDHRTETILKEFIDNDLSFSKYKNGMLYIDVSGMLDSFEEVLGVQKGKVRPDWTLMNSMNGQREISDRYTTVRHVVDDVKKELNNILNKNMFYKLSDRDQYIISDISRDEKTLIVGTKAQITEQLNARKYWRQILK